MAKEDKSKPDKDTPNVGVVRKPGKSFVLAVFVAELSAKDGPGKVCAAIQLPDAAGGTVDLFGSGNLFKMGYLRSAAYNKPSRLAARLSADDTVARPIPVIVGKSAIEKFLSDNQLRLTAPQTVIGDATVADNVSGKSGNFRGSHAAHVR